MKDIVLEAQKELSDTQEVIKTEGKNSLRHLSFLASNASVEVEKDNKNRHWSCCFGRSN